MLLLKQTTQKIISGKNTRLSPNISIIATIVVIFYCSDYENFVKKYIKKILRYPFS